MIFKTHHKILDALLQEEKGSEGEEKREEKDKLKPIESFYIMAREVEKE
jgi:hypothetical protein